MINTLLLLFLALWGASMYLRRQKIQDGKALFWATVSEPLHYVSDDPDDDMVTTRAANARAKLEAHGNAYLKDFDVWEYVYGATPECPTRDFSQWQDWVVIHIAKRREMWRQQKAGWNDGAAKQQFGGQTIVVQSSQN